MPKVSVLMPVYNTEEGYLREAIESILNQTFADFELVILNDGSTNSCEEVVLSYDDGRIRYFKNEKNLGLVETLNKGLDAAEGEYFARMDSDDISDKTRLEKQVKFLEDNKNIDVVGTDCAMFPKAREIRYSTDSAEIKNTFLFEYCAICSASAMVRKSTVDSHNLRYEKDFAVAEDYNFWLNMIDFATFSNIPEILYHYRWHDNNISKSKTTLQSLNAQYIMLRAQGKHFSRECSNVLSMIDRLKAGAKINSSDLKELEAFVLSVRAKMLENHIDCEYNLNRNFYKFALKKCKRDFNYLKLLWKSELNKFAQIKNWTKVENTIRLF